MCGGGGGGGLVTTVKNTWRLRLTTKSDMKMSGLMTAGGGGGAIGLWRVTASRCIARPGCGVIDTRRRAYNKRRCDDIGQWHASQ